MFQLEYVWAGPVARELSEEKNRSLLITIVYLTSPEPSDFGNNSLIFHPISK